MRQEIVKVFSGNNPFGWIALIDELGLLNALFPALHYNKHDEQPVRYHPFDTYAHTLLTLRHLQQINKNYLVKLAMLYHDVGKKDQYAEYAKATSKEEMQAIHSSSANHVISGPVFVERDFSALGFSNKEIEEVGFYVANHMRPGQILMAHDGNQIKRMRQLLSENGYDRVKNLLDITVADRRGQFNPLQSHEIDTVQVLYDILEKLYSEEGQFTMRDMAINGDDLMQEL
ncbi:HD domain-containing protein [Patescibacteria group bacterium]|nr:HD domain-containing protein [Patescibacteria group bacterium]